MNQDDLVQDYFPSTVSREVFYMLCGDKIASGVGRNVYDCAYDPTCVVKIEAYAHSFQNIHEWDLWQQHSHGRMTSLAKLWLAPCVKLSANGLILIQKKTQPVPWDWKLPKSIPPVLTDLKRDNFGIYKDRLVCHDYGRHDAISEASKRKALVRADWIDAKDGHFEPKFGQKSGVI